MRGDHPSAESLVRAAEAIALPLAANAVLTDIQFARSLIAIGTGSYEEAFQDLQRTFDPRDPAHHHFRSSWRIGEFAEAAVRARSVGEARDRSEHLAHASRSPRLHVALLYARPLLAGDDATAEGQFRAGLREDLSHWPVYRARLLLEYGTWLRRRRRIAEARMPLRAACDTFEALGAVPWTDRARRELRASRETRHQQPEASTKLTVQEQQICDLVSQGLSNREIGQRLYISHRTVGAHLYRIFRKVGTTSRGQLQAVLAGRTPAGLAS
jgi:DNA-binding CsgD family transcriptional regulator